MATIPVGYGDGWPRSLSGRGAVFIGGIRAPIAGRISMDSMVVDVTDVPPLLLFPGASAELIGPHQSIDDVARDADTIAYEILTRLGGRYRRLYSPSGKPRADKESVRCASSFWVRAWWGSPRPGILRRPVMMSSSSTARRGPRSKPV